MIHTDAVGRDFNVIETELANQRLFPFVFTPGADNLHRETASAKLVPVE
jgi:hypothetical protein